MQINKILHYRFYLETYIATLKRGVYLIFYTNYFMITDSLLTSCTKFVYELISNKWSGIYFLENRLTI